MSEVDWVMMRKMLLILLVSLLLFVFTVSAVPVNTFRIVNSQNLSVNDTIWARNYLDLTPAYNKLSNESIMDLQNISSRNVDGREVIDHDSLPEFARLSGVYFGSVVSGRSLGAMVSILVEAVKWLQVQMDDKHVRINTLEAENIVLKRELCVRDPSYSWCSG